MKFKDMYCHKGKMRCPLLDKSSSGQKWCNGHMAIEEEWEHCIMPKKRDKKIAQIEKQRAKANKWINGSERNIHNVSKVRISQKRLIR